jgi:hypothetical protein
MNKIRTKLCFSNIERDQQHDRNTSSGPDSLKSQFNGHKCIHHRKTIKKEEVVQHSIFFGGRTEDIISLIQYNHSFIQKFRD